MYEDMLLKAKYCREAIIKAIIKSGSFPDETMIQDRLGVIDTSLALFRSRHVTSDEYFNTDKFNMLMKIIYKDLEILYNLLYQKTVKDFLSMKAFIDTHLSELEDVATYYRLKAQQEEQSTTLGKTIMFKSSGFDIVRNNGIGRISLGNIDINKGSRVAFLIEANEIEGENVIFSIKKGSNNVIQVPPYNYNQESILIPGNVNMNTYNMTLPESQLINGPIQMDLGENKASMGNMYSILAGRDKVLVKNVDDTTRQIIMERPTKLDSLSFNKRSYIDFYALGAKSITFRFNKKPVSANFSLDNYTVTNLSNIHHFFIECEADFTFDFETEGGTVYAIKDNGAIDGDKLYFPKTVEVRDFYIQEYLAGDKDTYTVEMLIYNDTLEPIDIQSICIKELNKIGG